MTFPIKTLIRTSMAVILAGLVTVPSVGASPMIEEEMVGEETALQVSLSSEEGRLNHDIVLPNAEFLKLHIARLALQAGDELQVVGRDGEPQVFTHVSASSDGFWSLSVAGDRVSINLKQADENASTGQSASVTIDRVIRGLTEEERLLNQGPVLETVCGSDDRQEAACYSDSHPMEYLLSQATARLVYPCDPDTGSATCTCTAWRVGPANNTMMTNNHCLSSLKQIAASEVMFGYENDACDGGAATNAPVSVAVDRILVTDKALDMTLFTIKSPERIADFGYLTLESTPVHAGERIYIPQHPAGRDRELAIYSDQNGGDCQLEQVYVDGFGHQTDMKYTCDTEGGSSGSPVISRETQRVIGLHHLGSCSNAAVRMDLIYPKVAPYVNYLEYLGRSHLPSDTL